MHQLCINDSSFMILLYLLVGLRLFQYELAVYQLPLFTYISKRCIYNWLSIHFVN